MCYIYFAMVKPDVESRPVPQWTERRAEIGAASARSLLLTVLGEFVLPADEPVWTSAFLSALRLLGVQEKAARQALARMAAEGRVEPQRSGRRTCWRLTPAGHELLSTGAERIYGFGAPQPAWDGRWLVVLASIPDRRRPLRHLLRTRLAWSGLGSLGPGVWVSAHPRRQPEVRRVLQDVGAADSATFFVASVGELGDPRRIAGQAWDLTQIESRYVDFIGQVGGLRPGTPNQTLTAQVRLVQEWRRFPLVDPGLPAELLPPGWPGTGAAALFRGRHSVWKPTADAAWRGLANAR